MLKSVCLSNMMLTQDSRVCVIKAPYVQGHIETIELLGNRIWIDVELVDGTWDAFEANELAAVVP